MKNPLKKCRKGRVDHALQRALERYGVNYTKKDLQAIAKKIQKEQGVFMSRTSNTKTTWLVECYGQIMRVAYSKRTRQIISFLPLPLLPKHVWDKLLDKLYEKLRK